MSVLRADIAAYDRLSSQAGAEHGRAWVVFREGQFVGPIADFEEAATTVEERFDDKPWLS